MEYTCGPENDRRVLTISLPKNQKRIGVFVNGAIASSLLYLLLLIEKHSTNSDHLIKPFAVRKPHDSVDFYAGALVDRILDLFPNEPKTYPTVVGNPNVDGKNLVVSGIDYALRLARMDVVYLGNRQKLPEFGIDSYQYDQTKNDLTYPFLHINGSHIIDLYHQVYREHLLNFTHSCHAVSTMHCGNCDGCRERFWSFNQLGKKDTRFFLD
jgi:hypothetical protein